MRKGVESKFKHLKVDSWESQLKHKEKVAAKYEKVQTLRALVEMWEPNPDADEYVRELKVRLRSAECQLRSMGV